MHLNKILLFLGFISLSLLLNAQTSIAVLELEGKGLSEIEASILTDRLRNELFQTGKYRVIEREMMGEIMDEQGFQLSECTSTECMVEIGQLLGVDQMIGGSVSKFGSMYSVAVRLISVETGEYLGTATYDHEGRMEDLLKIGMRIVANQLSGFEKGQNVAVKQTASEPVENNNITESTIIADNKAKTTIANETPRETQVQKTQPKRQSSKEVKKEFPKLMLRSELGIYGLTDSDLKKYYKGTLGPLFGANIVYNVLNIPNFGAVGLLAGMQTMLLIMSPENTDYGDWDEQKVYLATKLGFQAVSSGKSKVTISTGFGYTSLSVTTVVTDSRGNTYDPVNKSTGGLFADFLFSFRPLKNVNLTFDAGYGTLVAGKDNIHGGNKIVVGGSINF